MRARACLALLVVAGSASCATASLDRRELRGTDELGHTVRDVPVRGFEVRIETARGTIEGELLAVDRASVWVAAVDGRVGPVPRETVRRVQVHVHETYGSEYGGWTAGGTAATITHGWMLIFTAPVWLIAGISTSVAESASGYGNAEGPGLDALYQFARFPQGPPPMLTGVPIPAPAPPYAPQPVPSGAPPQLELPPLPPAPGAPPVAAPPVPPAPGAPPGTAPPVPAAPGVPPGDIPPTPPWYERPIPAPTGP